VLRHPDGRDEEVITSWLLGCDGAHSTVRHRLGLPFAGEAEPNDWILADVHIDGPLPADEVSVYWHRDGVLFFFPFEPGRVRIVADQKVAAGTTKPPDPTLADTQAVVDARGPGGLHVHDPVWLSGFRINERKVADYRAGRAFLAGDAAHVHSPAGGQGMNTGMQDAYNLAWKLALVQQGRGRASPLLDSYSQERSEVGEKVLRAAGDLTRVATLRNPVAQLIRNHVASLLGSFGAFRRRFTSTMSELSIHYPHSPLNGEHRGRGMRWGGGGLRPGDRLPDAPLADPQTGRARRLLEVLAAPSHHLLALAGTAAPAPTDLAEVALGVRGDFAGLVRTHLVVPGDVLPADLAALSERFDAVWLDTLRQVHSQHAARHPSLVLVRPDGYIGYRSQPASGEPLRAHLCSNLLPADSGRVP
jgi:hypothetical protein